MVFKLAKDNSIIRHGCGARKGYNLAHTLFIIILHLVSEDMLETLKANDV